MNNYFDFQLTQPYVSDGGEFTSEVKVNSTKSLGSEFKIILVSDNGLAKTWNPITSTYVSQNDPPLSYPNFAPEQKVKLSFSTTPSVKAWFKIIDTKRNVTYETPKKAVWNSVDIDKYVSRVNERLVVEKVSQSTESVQVLASAQKIERYSKPELVLLPVFVVVALSVFVIKVIKLRSEQHKSTKKLASGNSGNGGNFSIVGDSR